ncbi:hypothetical protein EC991_004218 [Linnemannia zychae]|nr:hypothetical protein EC991_004218 [Linnemannia zychae]
MIKSSSSPPELFSPPLGPVSASSLSNSSTPSLTSLAPIPAIVLENEVEPLDLQQPGVPHSHNPQQHHHHRHSHSQNNNNHQHPHHRRPSSEETAPIAPSPTPPLTAFFFGKSSSNSVANTPASTPPASPALHAAGTSLSGRLPSIPRPSPMTPFRAAKKVVTSVTSVGTGLLPSKEQLGSIPVAGRILKHPVMDSTLTYIASKTTHRAGKGLESKPITPEDAPYLKLNRKLIDQSITLAGLAIEKEELSKTMDDEAADDAFELYLAAIATLMHSLPIETCDPLRREAFQSQLRGFLDEHQLDATAPLTTAGATIATKDSPDPEAKQRRRLRRRRHREYREQARSLIHQYSPGSAAHNHGAAAAAIVNPISSRRSSAPSSLPTLQQTPLAAQQTAASTPLAPASSQNRKRRRHRRRHGKNHRYSDGSSDYDDTPTLGDTIISTAVESAIRLKQSPIPDVLKTCFRVSRVILSKVDEKFHLQEKAWQLSKHSIEKAIELDEQYAIHEVVTETFFATVTGLVKAGIAYKETPGYESNRAPPTAPLIEPKSAQGPALLMATPVTLVTAVATAPDNLPKPQNPQAILPKKSSPMLSFPWRRHSVIEEEKEESGREKSRSDEEDDGEEDDDEEGVGYNSEDSSSSCFTTSEDGEQGSQGDESESEDDSKYSTRRDHRRRRRSVSAPYTDQVRQRLDMLMTLRGVASYIVGGK